MKKEKGNAKTFIYELVSIMHMPIPMLKGWDFSKEEIQKTKENNLMLMLDTETSNVCNLNCPYCYRDEYSKKHIALDNKLSIEQRKKQHHIQAVKKCLSQ